LVLDQTTGSPKEWGGGFRGYSRRVASRMGGNAVQNTFQASTAALLKEDVRYIGSSRHGFARRAGHAVLYSFFTYNRDGHPTLNFSNLGGYYAASAVTTLWQPGTVGNVARYAVNDGSKQIGLSVLVNLLQEFWPEVRRDLFRKK